MNYKIQFEKRSFKELDKLEQLISRRIFKEIKELENNFDSKDIKRLKGENTHRLRVGNYRVIFIIENNLIKILKIGHRKNIYKK